MFFRIISQVVILNLQLFRFYNEDKVEPSQVFFEQ